MSRSCAVLAAPVEGDALAPARQHVAVEAVVGGVQPAADEPLVEGRVGVVEHRLPRLEPVQLLGLARPPRLRVARGLLVDRGVASAARARGTPRSGSNVSHLQQLRQLAVERLAVRPTSVQSPPPIVQSLSTLACAALPQRPCHHRPRVCPAAPPATSCVRRSSWPPPQTTRTKPRPRSPGRGSRPSG